MIRHFVVPDTQVKPGVPTAHLEWAGKYIRDHKPNVIVQLGDWFDFPSLSSYDRGKRSAEGRRVLADYRAGIAALDRFMAPWYNLKNYKPRMVFLEGNHEERVRRYESDHPELEGSIPSPCSAFAERGWGVFPFLRVARIDGVYYSHYFTRSASGSVVNGKRGQPSARAQCTREMVSTVAGHKQGLDTAIHDGTGGRVRAIIAGSFYQHTEGYLTPQGNDHWQGCLMLNDVRNGDYDLCEVSLRYLRRKYRCKQ